MALNDQKDGKARHCPQMQCDKCSVNLANSGDSCTKSSSNWIESLFDEFKIFFYAKLIE